MDDQRVELVIPTYHPDHKFQRLLFMMEQQQVKPVKIHVIHTREGGSLEPWLPGPEYSIPLEVTVISKEEFDHGATRNRGMAKATTPFVLFMTQDAVPADAFLLEKLLVPMGEDKVAVSYARQLPGKESGVIESYTRQFNYPPVSCRKGKQEIATMGIKAFFCSDVCALYRKELHESLGGFVSPTIFNEDMIYAAKAIRAGYLIAYEAEAQVIHAHSYTCKEQYHRNFDMGVSQTMYQEVFQGIRTESEGIRLVKKTAGYLWKSGHGYLIPQLLLQSAAKYLGYRKGRKYESLSPKTILRCTMQPSFWRKREHE